MLLVAVFSAAQRGEQGLGKEGQGTQFTRFTSTKVQTLTQFVITQRARMGHRGCGVICCGNVLEE
jgi:hypothetical protein